MQQWAEWARDQVWGSPAPVRTPTVNVLVQQHSDLLVTSHQVPTSVAYQDVSSEQLRKRLFLPADFLDSQESARLIAAAISSTQDFHSPYHAMLLGRNPASNALLWHLTVDDLADWLHPRCPGLLMDIAIERLRNETLIGTALEKTPTHFLAELQALLPGGERPKYRRLNNIPQAWVMPPWQKQALRAYLVASALGNALPLMAPDVGFEFFAGTGAYLVDAGCGSLVRAQAYRDAGITVAEATVFEALPETDRPSLETLQMLVGMGQPPQGG